MFLLDTNIWLERLLDRRHSHAVGKMLDETPTNELSLTDFSLYTIGLILCSMKKEEMYSVFVDDILINAQMKLYRLPLDKISRLLEIMAEWNLDFDDAYQMAVCETYYCTLVSYDRDFDRTQIGRTKPEKIMYQA